MFLYTNPICPDNALVSWFWATIALHSQPTFLKKRFRRRKYLNSCFISVLFIAALIGYQDSQMNWAFRMGVQMMSTRGRKMDTKEKVLFTPRLVSFEDCLWTSLDGRRKTKCCFKHCRSVNKCICKSEY